MIYSTITSFITTTLLISSCNFLSTSHAQLVTPAPSADDYLAALQRDHRRRSISGLEGLECFSLVSGCSRQLTLFDACQAEYGDDPKYLYCLCTKGYYAAMTECDKCSVSVGAMPSSDLSLEIHVNDMECSSWYSSYGTPNGTESRTTAAGSKGEPASTEASVTATPKGAARSSASQTETAPSSASPTATATATATTPTEPFGGLIGLPTTATAASPAKTSNSGASSSRTGLGLPVLLALGGFIGMRIVY